MISPGANTPFVAIACGGTGGHLFPGLAVAEQLQKRGCAVALLISPKDVDQEAVKSARGMEIFTLPAVGLQNRNYLSFAGSFVKSWPPAKIFRQSPARMPCSPWAVLPARRPSWPEKISAPGHFSARIQHHPRPGQPFPGAVRGRGVCRLSVGGSPPARPQSDHDRHARPSAISASAILRPAAPRWTGSGSSDHSGHGRQPGCGRHQ